MDKQELDIKKCDAAHMATVLEELGIKNAKPKDRAKMAAILTKHFAEKAEAGEEMMGCDVCGGHSTGDYEACPFCGTAEEGDSGDDAEEIKNSGGSSGDPEEQGSDEEPAPKPKKGPKEVPAPAEAPEPTGKGKKAVKAKPAAEKAQPTKTTTALVKPKVVDGVLEGPATELDRAVTEVGILKAEGAVASWKLGAKLLEIFDKQLWKQRLDDKGKPIYGGFKRFVETELGMDKSTAYAMMDAAKYATEEQIRLYGTKKIQLLQKAPTDIKAEVEKMIKGGATKKEVEEKVMAERKKVGPEKARRDTGRKAVPAGKIPTQPVSDRVTVALMLTRTKLNLVTKATLGKEDPKPAKTINDEPVVEMELTNRVKMRFSLSRNAAGNLCLTVATKRAEA